MNAATAPVDEDKFAKARNLARAKGRDWVVDALMAARFHPNWIAENWDGNLKEISEMCKRGAASAEKKAEDAGAGRFGGAAARAQFSADDWFVTQWHTMAQLLWQCARATAAGAEIERAS